MYCNVSINVTTTFPHELIQRCTMKTHYKPNLAHGAFSFLLGP